VVDELHISFDFNTTWRSCESVCGEVLAWGAGNGYKCKFEECAPWYSCGRERWVGHATGVDEIQTQRRMEIKLGCWTEIHEKSKKMEQKPHHENIRWISMSRGVIADVHDKPLDKSFDG